MKKNLLIRYVLYGALGFSFIVLFYLRDLLNDKQIFWFFFFGLTCLSATVGAAYLTRKYLIPGILAQLFLILIVLIVSLSGNPLVYGKDIKNRIDETKLTKLYDIDKKGQLLNNVLFEEHRKVNEEIGRRQMFEDKWFQIKFIYVGALLSFFLLKVFGGNPPELKTTVERFKDLHKNGIIFVSLALSCIVCIFIDYHLVNNSKVTKQLGLWISENIENPFYKSWPMGSDKLMLWETVLRNPDAMSGTASLASITKKEEGAHHDLLCNLINWPTYMYSLTIFLYLSLAFCYHHETIVRSPGKRSPPSWKKTIWYCVHIFLFGLIIMAHQYPMQLNMQIQIFSSKYFGQFSILLIYFSLCFLLLIVQKLYHWLSTQDNL